MQYETKCLIMCSVLWFFCCIIVGGFLEKHVMETHLFQAIFLGFIQGASEFLPVSSTAHLILAPYFFKWNDPGLTFDVALHLGTLIAVVSFFWRDWFRLLGLTLRKQEDAVYPKNFLWFLAIATIPGAISGYFLEDVVSGALRHPLVVACALVIFGAVLYGIDMLAQSKKRIFHAGWKDIFIIGFAQILALVPGVSRSGITITAGRFLGYGREDSAKISFLLSTPIIFGAALSQISSIESQGFTVALCSGIVASSLSGYFAIKYLFRWISRIGYGVFFWYRLVLAILIVLVYYK